MVRHMLVQLPLLLALGLVAARALCRPPRCGGGRWNAAGVPGLILSLGAVAYWMIPRTLDAALDDGVFEAVKFLVLPLAGLILAVSWRRLPAVGRGAVLANLWSMAWVLGWAYSVAPQRICTNYRFDQQAQLGLAFLGLGALASAYLLWRVLRPAGSPQPM